MITPGLRLCAVVAMIGLAGCGSSDPFDRQPISGTVTFKGKPVMDGQIYFEPAEGQKLASNATISNGKFQLAKWQGLSPGKYHWQIFAADASAKGSDEEQTTRNLIPPELNGGTFEVKAGTETRLDIVIP
jgi:hypothetical protein